MRTVLNLIQGSPEWLKARAECDGTASEAPAMKGSSKYQTRDALLEQRKTGIAKEVNASMQAIFNRGHETEALARPIAERIIGDELSPTTVQLVIDGLTLIASLDGITFDDEVIFEHKLWNEELAASVLAKELDPHYTIQMDQELLVSGAKKCLFMVSDGTEEKCVWMWYESQQSKFDALLAGWKQFKLDLETFILPEREEVITPVVVDPFPMVNIQVRGELVQCNLTVLAPRFDKYLSMVNTNPQTDQEFADADVYAKASRTQAAQLLTAAQSAIDQILTVSDAVRMLESYAKKFNDLGLVLEKAVKNGKDKIKADEVMKAKGAIAEYVARANKELRLCAIPVVMPDFLGAIKGVRSIRTLKSRLNNAVAAAKIDIDAIARDLREKESLFESSFKDHMFLFADLAVIIHHPLEHFKLTCESRVANYKPVIEQAARPAEVKPAPQAEKTIPPLDKSRKPVEIERPSDEDLIQAVAASFQVGFELAADWMMAINYKAALEQAKMPF
jgi:hypothetical protein